METSNDHGKLKEIFKQAIIEAMEEKRDMVHDLLVEAMEDLAMIHAIEQGEETEITSRDEVIDILEGKA
jgi:spore coat polysaccharide biosynthesis protein SpsF (cytidylyltransferase family)